MIIPGIDTAFAFNRESMVRIIRMNAFDVRGLHIEATDCEHNS